MNYIIADLKNPNSYIKPRRMEQTGFAYKIINFFLNVSGFEAYALILGVLFICGMGVPIPEDITLISAGILAGLGKISFEGAMIAGLVGVMVGDTILFTIGQKYGRAVFEWPMFNKIFTPTRIAKAEKQIQEHAKKICFAARFMPGLRAAIFLTAGIMKVPFRTFFFQDGAAALISVPVWIYLGYWFADKIDVVVDLAKDINIVIGMILLLATVAFIYHIRRKKKLRHSS